MEGTATLDGTLDLAGVINTAGYDPNNPWIYQIMDCGGGCFGTFAQLNWTEIDGFYWTVLYGAYSVAAELLEFTGLTGTLLTQDQLNQLSGGTPPGLDLPAGMQLEWDGGQYQFVPVQYDSAFSNAATPEPATWALAVVGVAALGSLRRRQRRARRA